MLFTKDLTRLLLVPEGMEDTAYLPDTTDTVPVGAFSHSAQLTSVSVGESCGTYTAENGILYSKDRTTLIAAPAGYGSAVVIPEGVTAIGPSAFAGVTLQSIVALGAVTIIDPSAFSDTTKAEATVALPGGPDYDSHKAVWEQAGFAHFVESASPGDSKKPEQETSGFAYALLNDYTLSVSWQGSGDPEPDLVIPASVEFGGSIYRVSTIAAHAFEGLMVHSVTLPASIVTIGDAAFANCSDLTSISMPEGLISLGLSAFESTSLGQIILPATLSSIGERAFANCLSLDRILTLSDIDTISSSVIEGCTALSVITPYREDGVYAWNPGISAFGNHIEPYGIMMSDDSLVLTKGQSASLVEEGDILAPEGSKLTYAYPASCISVDTQGVVSAKNKGTSDVSLSLVLDDRVLAQGLRCVNVSSELMQGEAVNDTLPSRVPLTDVSLSPRDGGISLMSAGRVFVSGDLTYTVLEEGNTAASRRVSVKATNTKTISGTLSIPDTVTNADITYRVTEIADKAFFYCPNLVGSIFIPSYVTTIGEYAFGENRQFTGSLTIPNSVTTIKTHAFNNCIGLSGTLSIPSSVTSIGYGAFKDCRGFTGSLAIPSSVTTMGNQAFRGCFGFTGSLTVAARVIAEDAFYQCYNFSSITISSSVAVIGDSAFSDCWTFTTLTIPNSVTSIGPSAFSGCSRLSSVTLGSSMTTLEILTFYNCSGLTSISSQGTITSIDIATFTGCTKSDITVTLPKEASRTVWENDGFKKFTNYVSFDPRNGTPTPSTQAIAPNAKATEPKPDPTKAGSVFQGWFTAATGGAKYDFTTAVAGDMTLYAQWKLPAIGDAFVVGPLKYTIIEAGITDATRKVSVAANDRATISGTLSIPETVPYVGTNYKVTEIGTNAFLLCSNLTGPLTIPSSVTKIGGSAFSNCTNITGALTIPSSVISIGEDAFASCSKLTAIVLPNSVTTLSLQAFANCTKLTSISLGSGTTSLPNSVFINCTSLTSITSQGTITSITDKAFQGVTKSNVTIKLPANASHAVWTTAGFTKFDPCQITFDAASGSPTPTMQSVALGSVAKKPADPTKAGSVFQGWFTAATGGAKYDFTTAVAGDMTLYAQWKLPAIGDAFVVGPLKYTILEAGATDATRKVSVAANDRTTISGTLSIPETVPYVGTTYKVTEIGTNAFLLCSNLTGPLTIPSSVTKIGASAFSNCTNIAGTLTIPSSVISIDVNAFRNCSKLTAITLPNSVTTVSPQAFSDCSKLTSVSLGSGITSLPDNVFLNCTSLTSIASQGTITSITDKAFQGVTKSNITIKLPANASHAVWTTAGFTKFDPCQITFKSNGGTFAGDGEPTDTKIIEVKAGTPPGPAGKPVQPTRTGYDFVDWFDALSGGNRYNANSSVTVDMTLYAQWTETNYQITFESSGGSKVPPISNAHYGDKLTQPVTNKTGYTLEGWYTEASLTNKWDFATSTVTEDTKLWAKWTPNTYTIEFNPNGGTGTMTSQTGVVFGVSTPLKANTYTKEGHTFAGWATTPTGAVAYTNGAPVILIAASNLTLYAKWNPNSYNVVFDLDGGSGIDNREAPYGSTVTDPGVPTKRGYAFQGWYKDEAKQVAWDFASDTVGLSTIIYAKWEASKYTVLFCDSDGTPSLMQPQTFTFDAPNQTLTPSTLTKTGYLFAGWSKTQNGAKDFDDGGPVHNLADSGTVNLYAVWSPITYSVAFHPTTGTGSMDTQTGFTYDTPKALNPNLFTKPGHSFAGWATTEAGAAVHQDQALVSTLSATQGSTAHLYATWSINTYKVTFQSNGGTEVAPLDAAFDTTITKPTDPTRVGYAFAGWYRNQSLSIAWDFTNDKVQDDTLLYAKWAAVVDIDVPLDPKITIDAQGSVSSGPDATRFFESRSPKDVCVTEVTCVSTSSTEMLFPDDKQWGNIKVTLADPSNPDPRGSVEVILDDSDGTSFVIPKATDSSSKLFIKFGLKLPDDIKLSYADAPDGVPVAKLSYTFELLG